MALCTAPLCGARRNARDHRCRSHRDRRRIRFDARLRSSAASAWKPIGSRSLQARTAAERRLCSRRSPACFPQLGAALFRSCLQGPLVQCSCTRRRISSLARSVTTFNSRHGTMNYARVMRCGRSVSSGCGPRTSGDSPQESVSGWRSHARWQREPRLLLIDEPEGGLDEEGISSWRQIVEQSAHGWLSIDSHRDAPVVRGRGTPRERGAGRPAKEPDPGQEVGPVAIMRRREILAHALDAM